MGVAILTEVGVGVAVLTEVGVGVAVLVQFKVSSGPIPLPLPNGDRLLLAMAAMVVCV